MKLKLYQKIICWILISATIFSTIPINAIAETLEDTAITINMNDCNDYELFVYCEINTTDFDKLRDTFLEIMIYYNGNLINSTYGNNQTINYTYDTFNRLLSTTKQDKTLNYYYDNFNNIAQIKDITNNKTFNYLYDLGNRLTSYKEDNIYSIRYNYDDNNNVAKVRQNYLTYDKAVNYTYDRDSNPTTLNYKGKEITYNYDALERLVSKKINNSYTISYGQYISGLKTTTLYNSVNNNGNIINYEHDDVGNITTIKENNILVREYEYDDLNELIKEYNYPDNIITSISYDLGGNIISKEVYELDTNTLINTINYQYNNLNWQDQLTSYDGKSITYDAIGNPLTYGSNISYTWQNGRELATYSDTSKSLNVSYKYDENGIRTEKTVNGVTTKYYLEGSNIIFEDRDGTLIYYFYDSDGVAGFEYNNNTYYYVKNLQQDIISILNDSFIEVAKYTYDAFGNPIDIFDGNGNNVSGNPSHIANINPFRFKSYYWDSETELYYLNSRYYSPEFGRFINSDSILAQTGSLLGNNLYAYCENNAINCSDPSGHIGIKLPLGGTLIPSIQDFLRAAAKVLGKITGNPVTGAMFAKSFTAPAPSSGISKSTQAEIAKQMKKSSELNSIIKTAINNSNGTSFNTGYQRELFFGGYSDLAMAVGKANYIITGQKMSMYGDERWVINIYVDDLYNFDGIRTPWTNPLNAANNLGYGLEKARLISKYTWDISFSMLYK